MTPDGTRFVVLFSLLIICTSLVLGAYAYQERRARRDLATDDHLFTPQELALARLDHGAESFAANPEIFRRDGGLDVRDPEEIASHRWRDEYDEYIADFNRRWDDIWGDMPTSPDDALPADYWPSVAPVTGAPVAMSQQEFLAGVGDHLGPEATLVFIDRMNAADPVFSWSTAGYSTVPAPVTSAPVALLDRPRPIPRPAHWRPGHRRA
jgi:hypothetical protein